MKEKMKKIICDKNLYIFSAIVLIFFGMLSKMEFAVDSYASFTFSMKEFINHFNSSGRFVLIVAGVILKILNLKSETTYMVSFIAALACMIISIYKLYTMLEKDIKSSGIRKIIPILVILNAFSIEMFLFIEKGIMVFAIMMCIFAVGEIKKWLEEKKNKYLITTFIFMLLANFSYQGTVGIFIALAVVYIIKYSKNIKEFIINNVVVALSYGIPAIIDYILIKVICKSSRVSGSIILSESLKKVCSNTWGMMKDTYGILPKYFLLGLIVIIVAIIIYQIIVKKSDTKTKLVDGLKVIYIIAGTIVGAVAPQLMQNTDSIWFVARSTYSYAALYGVLVLYLFMNYDVKKYVKYIVLVMSIVLLVVQFNRFNLIETDRYKVNEMDYEITRNIIEKIDNYEKETGNKITKIGIYADESLEFTYSGIFATGDTNIKAYFKDWSIRTIIQYYTGRSLTIVETDSDIEKKFEENDWKSFDDSQLVFDGDTLHLCRY